MRVYLVCPGSKSAVIFTFLSHVCVTFPEIFSGVNFCNVLFVIIISFWEFL